MCWSFFGLLFLFFWWCSKLYSHNHFLLHRRRTRPSIRRLSLNLTCRSSASSILTAEIFVSRRLQQQHPLVKLQLLSRLDHREFDAIYDYDDPDDGDEDNTPQEPGDWARNGVDPPYFVASSTWAVIVCADEALLFEQCRSAFSLEISVPEGEERVLQTSSSSLGA